MEGVSVELHFFPCIMNNPVYHHRLQKWFKRNVDLQCSNVVNLPDEAGEIAVPTIAFNVIYQLCHLYHHFFDEGMGMRQMIDYYFVLVKDEEQGTKGQKALAHDLRYLGLWKFAGAVMYVLHEVLGLPEDKMICPMDQKRGELLLSEIMDGGNFGKHYVRYYPAEALSEPIFRTWHFFWRMKNKK